MPAPPFQQLKPNLVANPTFALSPLSTYWVPTAGNSVAQSTAQIYAAPFSCAVTVLAIDQGVQQASFQEVAEGVTYETQAWLYQASAGTIGLGYNEFDKDQVYLRTQGTDFAIKAGQWQRHFVLAEDPMGQNTRFVKIFISRRLAIQDYFVGMVSQALPEGASDIARPLQGKGAAR